MQSESFEQYRNNAKWFVYGYHNIAYWDSLSTLKGMQADTGALSIEAHNTQLNHSTIIFLHGFPSASWDWHYQWQTLQQHYRCIAFDMLGFGLSDKPQKHHYSVIEQANIALFMCQKLAIRNAHIVAHDYGVTVAQQLLLKQHRKDSTLSISSICFLNGGLFPEVHRPLITQKLLHSVVGELMVRVMTKATLKQSLVKIFGKHSPPQPHEIDILWQLLRFKQGHLILPKLLDYLDERKLFREPWVSCMQKCDVPLGFINGIQDPISGNHMLNRFKYLLPDSPTKALDVGHYPQLEAKEHVTKLMMQFLSTRQLG